MVNFGPLAAVKIVSLVWGTPANFSGFRVLASLLHGTLVAYHFVDYFRLLPYYCQQMMASSTELATLVISINFPLNPLSPRLLCHNMVSLKTVEYLSMPGQKVALNLTYFVKPEFNLALS